MRFAGCANGHSRGVLARYRRPRSPRHRHRLRSARNFFRLCARASADHGHTRSAAGAVSTGRFEVRRFRANIVVETPNDEQDFVGNAWIGQMLAIGDAVRLSITGPCPRCVMTALPQGDLPRDTGILRTAAQHNRANVGVYASVVQGGKVRRGDSVRLA